MENFKSYQIYIDSGIKWIGLIPKHWKVTKYKRLFNFINGNGFPERFQGKNEGEFPFYKVSDINFRGKMITSAINYVSLDDLKENKWNIVKPNSILTAKIGEALKKNHRKINQKNCLIDNNMMALSLNKGSLDYYYYFLSIVDMDWYSNPGTVPSINMRNLREDNLLIPSLEEQDQIAKFLNIKVSQIDDLIVDKEKLIELLEEKRQAIITEAVTKGLNPNVKMKDSGVDWIGEIPEHWNKNKIKYTSYVKGRIGWQGLRSDEFIDEGPHLVTGTDFINGLINWKTCYHISEERYNEAPAIQLKENDLLITKDGTIGKVAIVKGKPERAILNSGIFVTRPLNASYLTEYMYWLLTSEMFKKYIKYMETGSTIKHLYQETFVNFIFPLPDISEQKRIVEFLNVKVREVDSILQEISFQIEKLKDYRQSLIYEAVTGKIDVRDYKKVLS